MRSIIFPLLLTLLLMPSLLKARSLFNSWERKELEYLKSDRFISERKRIMLKERSRKFLKQVLHFSTQVEQEQHKKELQGNPWRNMEHRDWLALQKRVMVKMLAEEEHKEDE